MLFLLLFDYDPAKREEVVRKRIEVGIPQKAGTKLLGQWSYLGGGRVVTLVEADDPKVLYEAVAPYTNLGKFEILPVMETEKILDLLKLQYKVAAV
jgi:hypothetical protein